MNSLSKNGERGARKKSRRWNGFLISVLRTMVSPWGTSPCTFFFGLECKRVPSLAPRPVRTPSPKLRYLHYRRRTKVEHCVCVISTAHIVKQLPIHGIIRRLITQICFSNLAAMFSFNIFNYVSMVFFFSTKRNLA